MPSYQCYFLRNDGGIGVEKFDAETDAAALVRSDQLLLKSGYSAAELWCGARRVAFVTNPTSHAA